MGDPNANQKAQLRFVSMKHQIMKPKDRDIIKLRFLTV